MSNTQSTLDLIEQYMNPVRTQVQLEKIAAEQSYQDNPENSTSSNDKKVAKDKQTNLGLEQSEDAKDSGSNVEDAEDNNDGLAKKPTDDQGTIKLDVDQPVVENGNIGSIEKQEISQKQKTAGESNSLDRLANGILDYLDRHSAPKQKEASVEQKEVKEEEEDSFEKIASEQAKEFEESFLAGIRARQLHTATVEKTASLKEIVAEHGGVDNFLNKLAMEDPAAILPEGALPAISPEELEAMATSEEVPAENVPADDMPSEDELAEIATVLAEEGVSEEDLEKAFQDLQMLQEAGVDPQDLAQALSEGIGDTGSAEAEGEVEKVAGQCNRASVDFIKNFLFNK